MIARAHHKNLTKPNLLLWLIVLIILSTLPTFCNADTINQTQSTRPLHPKKINKRELIFVTYNSPTTYYLNSHNSFSGLEYDLATLFVTKYAPEYQIKFLLVNNIGDVIPTLLKSRAHIAVANFSITPARQKLVQFSSPYQDTQQQLVYNNEINNKPLDLTKVLGKTIFVPAGTSFEERLTNIKKNQPTLRWLALQHTSSESLLDQVANGALDYTVADNHLTELMQNYYPNLATAMPLGKPEKIAWALPKNADPKLVRKVNHFFEQIKNNGTSHSLLDHYYGNNKRLNAQDITRFFELAKTRLPKYVSLFKKAQEDTGIDWRLLAAVSYRESHWDAFNTSPTGVRGLMMLTEDTADLMGVTDRLDPKQSVAAGAIYLQKMIEKMPERIPEPDRTYMALASYNIGYRHLEDARVLAMRMKLNPNRWADVKKTLVMLNDPQYYATAKYGYASGGAPVIFVESIRSYQRILERYKNHLSLNKDFLKTPHAALN